MDSLLTAPFVRLIAEISTPAAVRRAEAGEDDRSIWSALSESGFADALVGEEDGGAGLQPADLAPLVVACGRHLLPAAFGDTVVARALASAAGAPLPIDTPVLLWPADASGRLRSLLAPPACGASHALVQRGGRAELWPLRLANAPKDGFGIVPATLAARPDPLLDFDLCEDSLLHWSAALTACLMAGAMERVLAMTLTHVNDRKQFDRPLAKFQAVQQQASVMAERVAIAAAATRLALARPMPGPQAYDAAVGKTVADESATAVCAIAHALHGAIGISAAHDLQLYTRRLKRWQASFGFPASWAGVIGRARLSQSGGTSVDFVRANHAPPAQDQGQARGYCHDAADPPVRLPGR